jgi:tRNA modification GTPase
MTSSDTIYALSSGAGLAAVAVIRISGPKTAEVVKALCATLPAPRRATLTALHAADGSVIDNGLTLWFPGPRSFTGEDTAEFHLHGGPAIVGAMFRRLEGMAGLRAAGPGEFTRRAFANGKMDLLEAEGLGDLIAAKSERQRRQALFHSGGQASAAFAEWRRQVVEILARLEAGIDFVEEADVAVEARAKAEGGITTLLTQIEREIDRGVRGERLRRGLTVVIAGPPNVGKSSLLNALAGRNAAIVSDIPGTTRDIVEVAMTLGGLPVTLRDTAGLRPASADPLEVIGMGRTRAAMEEGDLVLWLDSPDVEAEPPEAAIDSDTLWIWSKCDLKAWAGRRGGIEPLAVSAKSGAGLQELETEIVRRLTRQVSDADGALVTRQRHRDCLVAMRDHLRTATGRSEGELELMAEDLRLTARALAAIAGHVDVESLLDAIFREFCIGK